MDGVEEAGGLATRAEISPWVFPWPRLRFGATSPGFWPPTAGLIFDSPVAIATAAGVDAAAGVEGVEAEGLGCLLADRSSLFRVISGATVSGTGFTGLLGAGVTVPPIDGVPGVAGCPLVDAVVAPGTSAGAALAGGCGAVTAAGAAGLWNFR